MATLMQYGRVGKPVKMNSLPTPSSLYEDVIVLVDGTLYQCIDDDGTFVWTTDGLSGPLEMPIIRFVNASYRNGLDAPSSSNPITFTVRIMGGTLKVGDRLQICSKRLNTWSVTKGQETTTRGRRYQLKAFAYYEITEKDLNKEYLHITINPDENWKYIYRNNRKVSGPSPNQSYSSMYFRIRRPRYDKYGNTIDDALFSNIEKVDYTYVRQTEYGRRIHIK